MLRDLDICPVYDSENHDLIREVQVPLLSQAQEYLRGVGFFSSGWLRLASQGLVALVEAGGKARIIASPVFEAGDWEALQAGCEAKNDATLWGILRRNIDDLSTSLESDTRNVLAWMVADGVLEFRVAVPRDADGISIYHDKVAIYLDGNGDKVATHGSLNDSVQGSLNGEALSVFRSWEPGQTEYVRLHHDRLEALWLDKNKQFRAHEIPDSVLRDLISLRSTAERPYRLPNRSIGMPRPLVPRRNVKLRDYQETAIERWMDAGCRGVFEMATGTGKTVTSLAAATRVHNEHGRLALIVLVPYLHLLDQWAEDCENLGFSPIQCSGSHDRWDMKVRSAVKDLNLGVVSNICIVSVHHTASTPRFASAISRLRSADVMLIGDEVHGLGAPNLRSALVDQAEMRLGLSATPRRWFDEEGTAAIYSYFGKTCYEYSLEEAIGTFLVPYEYHPVRVSLTDDELEEYESLTQKIVSISEKAEEDKEAEKLMKVLMLQRARIVYSAEAKLPKLINKIQSMIREHEGRDEEPRGILIYCAPGKHKEVLRAVSATGLRCHEFVHSVSLNERRRLLEQFDAGQIQVLVAIRCLDEGVDVPSTRMAYIMASSTNPREFVQRRGRILRLAPNKERAIVYDFIVVPPDERIAYRTEADIGVLKREMPRFAEFSSSACNEYEARAKIRGILDRVGMLHLLDERPWDVYHSLKGWDWDEDE
jgi:superfamily II DNA or RNA helicase